MESSWRRWYRFLAFITATLAVYSYGEFFLDLCLTTWYEDLGMDVVRYRDPEEIAGVYINVALLRARRGCFPLLAVHFYVGLANSLYPVEYRLLLRIVLFSTLLWLLSIYVAFRYSGTIMDRWDFEEEDLFVHVPSLVDYLGNWIYVSLVILVMGQLPIVWVLRSLYLVNLESLSTVNRSNRNRNMRWVARLSFLVVFLLPRRISGFILFDDLLLLTGWWFVGYSVYLSLRWLVFRLI